MLIGVVLLVLSGAMVYWFLLLVDTHSAVAAIAALSLAIVLGGAAGFILLRAASEYRDRDLKLR